MGCIAYGVRYVPNLTLFLWVRVRGSARALIFLVLEGKFLPCGLIGQLLAALLAINILRNMVERGVGRREFSSFYGACWVRTHLYFLIVGLLWDQWSIQQDTPYMYMYMYRF